MEEFSSIVSRKNDVNIQDVSAVQKTYHESLIVDDGIGI